MKYNKQRKANILVTWAVLLSLLLAACNSATVTAVPSNEDSADLIANCAPATTVPQGSPAVAAVTATPVVANAPVPTPTILPLPVPTAAFPNDGKQSLETVAQDTAKVRGLPFKQPVEKFLVKRSELGNYFFEDFKRTNTPEDIARFEKTLRLFGLVPNDFDYIKSYSALLGEQVLGFYNPDSKKFYVVVDDPNAPISPLRKFTTEHELTHALQDQYFDFSKFRPSRKPSDKQWNDDRDLASTALAEGDAVQSSNNWLLGGYLKGQEFSQFQKESIDASGASTIINKVPLFIRESLYFPYNEGVSFVGKLCKQGGFDAVNKAFVEYPPISTSQVLHFDKYTKRVEPLKVEIPDLTETLGKGWTSVDINTMGEFQARLWLNGQMDRAEAVKAANGWAGDRYQVVENDQKKQGFAWRSGWDSDNDAKEFFDSSTKYLKANYKLSGDGGSGDKRTWQNADYDLSLTMKGKEMLIVVMPKGDALAKVTTKIGF